MGFEDFKKGHAMNSDANKAVDMLLRRALQNDDNKFHYADETRALAEQVKQALTSQSEMTLPELPEGWEYNEIIFGDNNRVSVGIKDAHYNFINTVGLSLRGAALAAIAKITPPQKDNTDGQ